MQQNIWKIEAEASALNHQNRQYEIVQENRTFFDQQLASEDDITKILMEPQSATLHLILKPSSDTNNLEENFLEQPTPLQQN